MNAVQALARLRHLRVPVFTTVDASVALGLSVSAASKTLRRLAGAGLARSPRKGLWTVHDDLSPLLLPEYLTAPQPSYVSLQTALHLHGMIDQIPAVVYAVTLARGGRVRTRLGTFSLHRVAPEFFGGFDVSSTGQPKVATPEKALLDVFYLSAGRSRLFASLPELEMPDRFSVDRARAWVRRIPSSRLRTIVSRRLEATVEAKGKAGRRRGGRGRAIARAGEPGARRRRRAPPSLVARHGRAVTPRRPSGE